MIYHRDIRIEFNHCDPAGIVFYPRFFEMINSVAENFFRDIAELPFEQMMADHAGAPTARIETAFHAPARLGEILDWRLAVTKLGTTSIGFHIEAHAAGIHRLSVNSTIVFVNAQGRPQPWPDAVRARIAAFQEKP